MEVEIQGIGEGGGRVGIGSHTTDHGEDEREGMGGIWRSVDKGDVHEGAGVDDGVNCGGVVGGY